MVLHAISGIGWMGVDIALLILLLTARTSELADAIASIVARDGWPTRAAAYARYNLACFQALGGSLDAARALLRQALPEEEELRGFAPTDDDLIALRDEIPALSAR